MNRGKKKEEKQESKTNPGQMLQKEYNSAEQQPSTWLDNSPHGGNSNLILESFVFSCIHFFSIAVFCSQQYKLTTVHP